MCLNGMIYQLLHLTLRISAANNTRKSILHHWLLENVLVLGDSIQNLPIYTAFGDLVNNGQ